MSKRRVLIAGFILVALAGGTVAGLTFTRGGEKRSAPGETQQRGGTTSIPANPESAGGPIRFVLSDRYRAGDSVDVVIENAGRTVYVFQSFYQACFLSYFDSSGRRFIIPPGTHCDLRAWETIGPGEREKLFRWSLDECVKDDWGCVESRPLPPGVYTIKGRFRPKGSGMPAQAEATFRIVTT
jgi:hypothetical protein